MLYGIINKIIDIISNVDLLIYSHTLYSNLIYLFYKLFMMKFYELT